MFDATTATNTAVWKSFHMNQSDVIAIIKDRAKAYGVDPATLVAMAGIETGGTYDPGAANPRSSARGLFQFMTRPGGSWQEYGKGADVFDPMANADAGARITADNIGYFRSRLGRDPTPGEIYLMHQQGRGGAVALLSDPGAPAIDALRSVYRSPETAQQAFSLNGGRPGMTAGEFAQLWGRQMDRRMGAQPAASQGLIPDAAAFSPQPMATIDTGLVPNFPNVAPASPAGETAIAAAGQPPSAFGSLGAALGNVDDKKLQAALTALKGVADRNKVQDDEPLQVAQLPLGPTPYAQSLRAGILSNYLGKSA